MKIAKGAPDLHMQAGSFLVGQAVVHAVSESKAVAISKTCFQLNHMQVQNKKLPDWLPISYMTLICIEQFG